MKIGDMVQVLGEQTRGIVRAIKNDRWSPSKGSLVTFQPANFQGEPITLRSNILRVVAPHERMLHRPDPAEMPVKPAVQSRNIGYAESAAAPFPTQAVETLREQAKQMEENRIADGGEPRPVIKAAPSKDTSFLELTLDEAYVACAALGNTKEDLREKYRSLNLGMQKMNLVNRLRAAARKAATK